MEYILIIVLFWVTFFVIFASIGIIFTITSGMYDKDDIYICVEGGALVATSLIIVGCVSAVTLPLIISILINI